LNVWGSFGLSELHFALHVYTRRVRVAVDSTPAHSADTLRHTEHVTPLAWLLEVSGLSLGQNAAVFLSPSAQISRQYFKLGDERFLPYPCQLII
jgi:hypothetical protein